MSEHLYVYVDLTLAVRNVWRDLSFSFAAYCFVRVALKVTDLEHSLSDSNK